MRDLQRILATALTLLALGAVGCGDANVDLDGATSLDAAVDTGATPAPPVDGGGLDVGGSSRSSGVEYDLEGAMVPGAAGGGLTMRCNEELSAAGAPTLSCDTLGCEQTGACCVGDGACCETAPSYAPASPDWRTCAGPAESCAGIAGQPFGSPRPSIADGALLPLGDGDFDSGVLLDRVVDLRSTRLDLEVEFVVPADCGDGCLEGAAVSLTTQDTFDDTTHVSTVAGLTMSGSRRRVSLILHDRELAHWPAGAASTWTLRVAPDGLVQVLGDGDPMTGGAASFEPVGAARVVIFGHDRNPMAGHEVAGVRTLSLTGSRCDIPTLWSAHRDVDLRERGIADVIHPNVDALATARDVDDQIAAVLQIDGDLFTARQPGSDDAELTLAQVLGNPLYRPSAGETLTAPTLYRKPSGQLVLLFGVSGAGGAKLLTAAYPGVGAPLVTQELAVEGESPDRVAAYEALTTGSAQDGTAVVVARRRLESGASDWVAYRADTNLTSLSPLPGTHLADALGSSAAPAYDATETGGLALVGTNHAWQLYYARRSGARWSIGLLVSNDLVYWRHAAGGESVLRPDGSAHERIGTRAPAVDVFDGRVTLRYVGLDGAQGHVRVATRSATDNGGWF